MDDPRLEALMSLHGKRIVGTTQFWGVLTLELDDGSEFEVKIQRAAEPGLPWLDYTVRESAGV